MTPYAKITLIYFKKKTVPFYKTLVGYGASTTMKLPTGPPRPTPYRAKNICIIYLNYNLSWTRTHKPLFSVSSDKN